MKPSLILILLFAFTAITSQAVSAASSATSNISPKETDKRMVNFLKSFKGDSDLIEAGLRRYRSSKLDDPDTIDAYNLSQPKILSTTDQNDMRCYLVETTAGFSIRTWDICWKVGTIKTIRQTTMRFASR